MQQWGCRVVLSGLVCAIGLAVTMAWAQPAKAKLERLKVAIAPLGWDTNFTWLQSRSGMLDKRPALEYLVGIDRRVVSLNCRDEFPQTVDKDALDRAMYPGSEAERDTTIVRSSSRHDL
jgi:hypothetical protein